MNQSVPAFLPPVALVAAPAPRASVCRKRVRRRARMTLRPQDSEAQSGRDRAAIEAEFAVNGGSGGFSGEVDADLARLRERMQLLSRKDEQWREICEQFAGLAFLTGLPMVDGETGEPTPLAWGFLSVSVVVPTYLLFVAADWLHVASSSFGSAF